MSKGLHGAWLASVTEPQQELCISDFFRRSQNSIAVLDLICLRLRNLLKKRNTGENEK